MLIKGTIGGDMKNDDNHWSQNMKNNMLHVKLWTKIKYQCRITEEGVLFDNPYHRMTMIVLQDIRLLYSIPPALGILFAMLIFH